MSWNKVKLGDISTSIQPGPFGSQLHSSDYSNEGTPIIMPKDMIDGHISHTNLVYVSEEHVNRLSRHQVHKGNLMVARKGDVRKCVFITDNEEGWMTGSDCLKVTLDEEKCVPKYIYYQLRSPFIGKWLETISIGATMPSLNTGLLSGIELFLPPLVIQEQIANVLTEYDALIQNNQKQIKLLEEAAQRLYKEWFVDLRFPGYEDVQIVDGVPEGWRLGVLSDVASLNVTAIDYDYPYSEIEYVDLGSVNKGHILGKKKYLLQDAPGRARRLAKHGDVIWGMVRPNLKAYALVQNESSNTVYSTGFAIITAKSVPFTFMYCATTTEEFVGYLVGCTNGAAYPSVKPSHFQNAKILIPSENVLKAFHKITEPIFCKIGYLDEMNNYLAEARDRLLPKLMSGGIEL